MFLALAALVSCASTTQVLIASSGTWMPPAGSSGFHVALGGGGGGASVTEGVGIAGGGSGSLYETDIDTSLWDGPVIWQITIGAGGTGRNGADGGNGGTTTLLIVSNTTGQVLQRYNAYGGGGGRSTPNSIGGGGAGSDASASGPIGGAGSPAGPNGTSGPVEGQQIGPIKAGGSGGALGNSGAPWGSTPGGQGWTGSQYLTGCYAPGGAAGFNGKGGDGIPAGGEKRQALTPYAPANSGGGGGAEGTCIGTDRGVQPLAADGASGACIITYLPPTPSPSPSPSTSPSVSPSASPSPSTSPSASPSPSVSPSPSTSPSISPSPSASPSTSPSVSPSRSAAPSPSRSATPSPSPSYSPQPINQNMNLKSPANNLYLSARQSDGFISLVVVPSAWEWWTVQRINATVFTIMSYHGKYLSVQADGTVIANRDTAQSWEQFTATIKNTNQWTFQSLGHATYLDSNSTGQVFASTNSAAYWIK